MNTLFQDPNGLNGNNENGVPVTTILINNAVGSGFDRALISRSAEATNNDPSSFEIIGIDSEPDRSTRERFGFNYFRISSEVTEQVNPSNQRRVMVVNGTTGELLLNIQPRGNNPIQENQSIIDAINSVMPAQPADPFTQWAEENNIPEADRSTDADPDGDGIPNLLEYGYGTDPMAPSQAQAPRLTQDLQFIYQRSKTAAVTEFRLLSSNTLEPGSFLPFASSNPPTISDSGDVEVVTFDFSAAGQGPVFFRVDTNLVE